ncbi:hypothetical protein HPB47_004486 [Ixodes persulcatus]|uniref:Uncharacterized protein n=1 Tax=Ixodes persulcatus TaxID=34615 RepID=A0AC60PG69_IXOPE|nr:hypothetical protein HPB47_004486 [Ixodes persulcatus]
MYFLDMRWLKAFDAQLSCKRGSSAEAVSSRRPAPSKVPVATQVSFLDHGKPLQSSTPRLKLTLPVHSISAAADAPSGTKDLGTTVAIEVTPSSRPPGPAPQATERVSRSSSLGRTSPSRKQHVSRATDDTDGTVGQPSTSTAAPSGQCRDRGLSPQSLDNTKASCRPAKKSPEAEKNASAGNLSVPEPDSEDMECQTVTCENRRRERGDICNLCDKEKGEEEEAKVKEKKKKTTTRRTVRADVSGRAP